MECSPSQTSFVKQLDLYDLIAKIITHVTIQQIYIGSKIQGAFYITYLLCCFNLKIISLSIHLNWGLCIKCPNRYRYIYLWWVEGLVVTCLNCRQNARWENTSWGNPKAVHEVTGGTLKTRVQQTRPGNSENAKREWSANMTVRLVKNTKRKASRTSRIPRTYKKKLPPTIL